MKNLVRLTFVFCCLIILTGCSNTSRVSTPEDRAALFDYIVQKTMEREAFSPIKNEKLNLDVEENMRKFRDAFIAADTDQALFNVLMKLSNARKDRHLRVDLVDGGLRFDVGEVKQAPIRFAVDFGMPGNYFFFVADLAKDVDEFEANQVPQIGDKLISVNGMSIDAYFEAVEPYHRYSSIQGLWWKFAEGLSQQTYRIPPTLESDQFVCMLEKGDGAQYKVQLPYLEEETIQWQGYFKSHGENRYPGFELVYSVQTYDLYKNEGGKSALLLDWYGFRHDLVKDMDRLVAYAEEHELLDHALIWDGTRARGGSKGAYAIQKLSPKSFKTTFGNVRISDITIPFIEGKKADFAQRKIEDAGVKETIDDGTWLMDWLETDVMDAIHSGNEYSNNVPFKSAHLPKDSDGILQPAAVHFRGPMVCLFGPHGGSHLDQFAAMIKDNNLGYTIGMPTGGYSNTWEWEEDVHFPISGKPVARFMWSMGHTIRPNGEILEGNAAEVDEYIPLTRENYLVYYEKLLSSAFQYLNLSYSNAK